MRKTLFTFIATLFVVSFISTGISFAGSKCDFVGKIKSVDKENSTFTVVPSGSEEEKVLKVDKEYMAKKSKSTIKSGKIVEVFVDKNDPTMATKVKRSLKIPVGC